MTTREDALHAYVKERLREETRLHGTKTKLAKKLGITLPYLSELTQPGATKNPSEELIEQIAKLWNVSMPELRTLAESVSPLTGAPAQSTEDDETIWSLISRCSHEPVRLALEKFFTMHRPRTPEVRYVARDYAKRRYHKSQQYTPESALEEMNDALQRQQDDDLPGTIYKR